MQMFSRRPNSITDVASACSNLLVDAAVVILETQTVGSSAITLIPSSLPPPLPLSTH